MKDSEYSEIDAVLQNMTKELSALRWVISNMSEKSSTDEGDTNTNRAYEAGELENTLKLVCHDLLCASQILLNAGYPQIAKNFESDIDRLQRLIQKHEGLNRS